MWFRASWFHKTYRFVKEKLSTSGFFPPHWTRCFSLHLNNFGAKLKWPDMDLTGYSPAKDATAANYENLCELAGKHKCTTHSTYMLDHCSKQSLQSQNLSLRNNQAKLHHCNSSSVSIAFLFIFPLKILRIFHLPHSYGVSLYKKHLHSSSYTSCMSCQV